MDSLALSATTATACIDRALFNFFSSKRRTRTLFFPRKPRLVVFAAKDDPRLDEWDQMELKFGQLLGEDPKLTLAKIMGRKSNPDVSYLEIEKSFYKKKGKLVKNDVEEVPFDGSEAGQSSISLNGLNLVRPVPKKGTKFEAGDKSNVSEIKKPCQSVGKTLGGSKSSVPNVILRKPSTFYEDDVDAEKSTKLRIKPNLSLKMGKELVKEKFSDITLLKKPEPMSVNTNLENRQEPMGVSKVIDDVKESGLKGIPVSMETTSATESKSLEYGDGRFLKESEIEDDSVIGLQPLEQSDVGSAEEKNAASGPTSGYKFPVEAALQGKPKRLDQSFKETSNSRAMETVPVNPECHSVAVESESYLARSDLKECEDIDWKRAEDLSKNEGKEEVELISSSTRGFVVSFGSLIGFLPYRNLAARWKFLAFESWLRRKGLDPSMYKQSLGIIGNNEVANKNNLPDSNPGAESEKEISRDTKLEDLLRIYDQEKIKFLSSFVGQRIKVNVVLADRKSRKLIFSMRRREKEELVEKKRSLMAKLSIGDVVKCCFKKITYFGIFVEVEGVSALIHQTEVSWDATLDPAACFKIGQIVEAKVHQLDFALERIFLSLKEITPDPLIEALECVVGDHNFLDGRLEAAQADTEWAEVESLVKELKKIEGIQSVSKGRFFLSPGLAPTFQVYMASMFENQYKLLARSGNKVQEVMVQASLGKEEIKSAILTCTNRVE